MARTVIGEVQNNGANRPGIIKSHGVKVDFKASCSRLGEAETDGNNVRPVFFWRTGFGKVAIVTAFATVYEEVVPATGELSIVEADLPCIDI